MRISLAEVTTLMAHHGCSDSYKLPSRVRISLHLLTASAFSSAGRSGRRRFSVSKATGSSLDRLYNQSIYRCSPSSFDLLLSISPLLPEILTTMKPPPTSPVSDRMLVSDLDIFILIVILAFSLFNVPRALAYIANNRSDASQGYLLRSSTQFRMYRPPSATTSQSKEKEPLECSTPSLESAAERKEPWHFPMHFSLRHPSASVLHHHVLGNYTVIQVFLMAGYTAAVFYAAFYKSNPIVDASRVGWIIISQIPFVYAFATKNNVIGLLVGVGYEKVRV